MLDKRVLTAAVLGSITIAVILSGSKVAFSLLTGVMVIIAAWEWAGLSGFRFLEQRIPYLLLVTVLLSISYGIEGTPWLEGIIVAGLLWWCCACVIVIAFQQAKALIPSHRLITATTGIFVLIPAWSSLVNLYAKDEGPGSVMFLFFLIWTADIAAYFIGGRWGRHSLAGRISPGKSWEGVAGGMLVAALPAWGYVILGKIKGIDIMWFFFLCLVTVGFSIIGDLFESMCKRNAHLKDSGRLLPGHGGVLDRIDSLTAAAPVFVIGFSYLGGRI